jgi:hypothetical protein
MQAKNDEEIDMTNIYWSEGNTEGRAKERLYSENILKAIGR